MPAWGFIEGSAGPSLGSSVHIDGLNVFTCFPELKRRWTDGRS